MLAGSVCWESQPTIQDPSRTSSLSAGVWTMATELTDGNAIDPTPFTGQLAADRVQQDEVAKKGRFARKLIVRWNGDISSCRQRCTPRGASPSARRQAEARCVGLT